ncbi:MAG: ceramide glucosyltransferase, partial [Hyphomicrobium sp.]
MPEVETVALAFLSLSLALHYVSIALVIYRSGKPLAIQSEQTAHEPVSILRPVCGLDQHDALTLASCLDLAHSNYEVIFCCAKADDPAVRLVKQLMASRPAARATLLIGDDRPTANPKLNNLMKGWPAARHDWIVIADSNVLMPPGYLNSMLSAWRDDTGLVCSPPLGSMPQGFWAEVECAFLNTYQARWQIAADTLGFGFAQGKSMLWRRDLLDCIGGLRALGAEIAEDAAATKIVRYRGLRVRLVDRPFEQPLGLRTVRQVWDRQVRWARLRRATFPAYFLPEVLTGILPPMVAAIIAAEALAAVPAAATASLLAVWYLPEALLNRRAG